MCRGGEGGWAAGKREVGCARRGNPLSLTRCTEPLRLPVSHEVTSAAPMSCQPPQSHVPPPSPCTPLAVAGVAGAPPVLPVWARRASRRRSGRADPARRGRGRGGRGRAHARRRALRRRAAAPHAGRAGPGPRLAHSPVPRAGGPVVRRVRAGAGPAAPRFPARPGALPEPAAGGGPGQGRREGGARVQGWPRRRWRRFEGGRWHCSWPRRRWRRQCCGWTGLCTDCDAAGGRGARGPGGRRRGTGADQAARRSGRRPVRRPHARVASRHRHSSSSCASPGKRGRRPCPRGTGGRSAAGGPAAATHEHHAAGVPVATLAPRPGVAAQAASR